MFIKHSKKSTNSCLFPLTKLPPSRGFISSTNKLLSTIKKFMLHIPVYDKGNKNNSKISIYFVLFLFCLCFRCSVDVVLYAIYYQNNKQI